MPTDISSYTQPQPSAPNLVGYGQAAVGMQNALNQNRLFQQQFQAKQGIGQALSRATDPNTNQIDYNKAAVLMAADPRAAGFVPEFINQMAQANNLNAETTLKNIDVAQKQQDYYAKGLSPLLQKGASVSKQDVMDQIGTMYANGKGVLDRDHALAFIASMPQEDGPALQNYIQTHAQLAQTNADAMGHVLAQSTGGGTQLLNTNPVLGNRPTGFVENTPTPGEMNAMTPTVDAQGNIQNTPRAQAAPMISGAGAPIQGTGGNGPSLSALNPTTAGYKTGVGKDMAEYKSNLDSTVGTMSQTMQQMQEANGLLGKNGGMVTGGGGAVRASVGQFLQAIGASKDTVDKVSNGSLPASQEFAKLMTPIAVGNLRGAVGSGQRIAQQEVMMFVKQNPNLDTDPRAVQKMFGLYQQLYKTKALEQKALASWAQGAQEGQVGSDGKPIRIENFPAWWTQQLQKHGVVSLTKDGQ